MSGLAAVLAGHHPPGVFTWHSALPVEDVAHAVEHAGRRFGYVDGWTAQTKEEFLTAVADALDFPDHFGRNLDAFADCLRAVDGTVLLWDGWSTLARGDAHTFTLVRTILAERAAAAGSFVALLRGEGPDLDVVESLD